MGIFPFQGVEAYPGNFIDLAIMDDPWAKVNPTYARGVDYEVTALGNFSYGIELGLPKLIWDEQLNRYSPYVFRDQYENNGYYEVANGRIGLRIYDYYASFYTPDMSEVRLYDERWEVQRYREQGQGRWDDIGAQGGAVTWDIVQTENEINITKSFSSWGGLLEITYNVKLGAPLKHTVVFTSVLEQEVFRLLQRWAGIVADRVNREKETDNGYYNASRVDSKFTFLDSTGEFMLGEDQKEALQWLEPIVFEPHAQGLKGNYIFSNWTLTQGQKLTVDPDNWTSGNPTTDFSACYNPTTAAYYKENTTALYFWKYSSNNCIGEAAGAITKYGVAEWDTTAVPDGATITDTVFKYHGAANNAFNARGIYNMTNQPSTTAAATVYADARNGNVYVADQLVFPVVAAAQQIDLGALADWDVEGLLGSNWFAIGVSHTGITADTGSAVWETSHGGTNPNPTLYLVYDLASTLTVSVYAADGTTTADDLTDVYLTYVNVTASYTIDMSGLSTILAGQAAGSINFTVQAYNTTNSNSFIKINGTNMFEYTFAAAPTIRFWISIYQSVEWVYESSNSTEFTMQFFEITFGNNGTKANITSNSIFVNGSNTIHQIRWQGDNVKNATTSFNITATNQDLVFDVRIYTMRLQPVHAIGLISITDNVYYNATLANSTVNNYIQSADGRAAIYLQNDTNTITFTGWWQGIKVNSTISLVVTSDNTNDTLLQVGRDLTSQTFFAEGTSGSGVYSLMIEGLGAQFQIAPLSWIMNTTTYTKPSWMAAGYAYNYTAGTHLLNLSTTILKPTTTIHTISMNLVARQLQFNATGSETLWIFSYGGVACVGNIRTIYLVNEVNAQAFDTPGFYNVNVTAFYDDYYLSVGANVQNVTVCDEPLILASVNATSTGQTYFRSLIPSDLVQNMYIPDIQENSITLYTLQIVDLTEIYAGAKVIITMSGVEISSGYLDGAFRFEVYLIDGFFFDMTITSNGHSFTAGGLNANPGDNDILITINQISLASSRTPRSNIIQWFAQWVGPNIAVAYNDTDVETTALNIKLYEQNFDNKTYVLVFDTDYGASSDVTALYAGNSSRGYYAKIVYTQTSFGTVTEQRPVVRSNLGIPMPNLPASVLGLDMIFPDEPNAWVYLISMFIVIGTSLVFVPATGAIGAVIVGVIGVFFIAIGWLPGTVAYGIGGLSIAILATWGKRKGSQ